MELSTCSTLSHQNGPIGSNRTAQSHSIFNMNHNWRDQDLNNISVEDHYDSNHNYIQVGSTSARLIYREEGEFNRPTGKS